MYHRNIIFITLACLQSIHISTIDVPLNLSKLMPVETINNTTYHKQTKPDVHKCLQLQHNYIIFLKYFSTNFIHKILKNA